jgi:autotransporter-associated beta strand protein
MLTMAFLNHQQRRRLLTAAIAAIALPTPTTTAIVWNNDPARGVASPTGLTDMPGYFANVHVITNTFNSTRGTATYLGNGWIITARHVVQGTSYSNLAPAQNLTFNVNGTTHTGAVVVPAPDSAEIALVKLQTTPNLAAIPSPAIYTGTAETGKLAQIGGYGLWGAIGGATSNAATFHRAYNVAWQTGSFVLTQTDGEPRLRDLNLLEGGGMSGDSGSPLFILDGPDSAANDWSQYKLAGVLATSQGNSWGADSSYARTRNYHSLITSLAYGSGRSYKWSRGIAGTFSWNNSPQSGAQTNGNNWNSPLSPAFPTAAGDIADLGNGLGSNQQTIHLDQNVTLGQLSIGNTNNGTGTQTLAPGGPFTLTFDNAAAPAILTHHAGARADSISAPIHITSTLLVANPSSSPLTLAGPITGGTLNLTSGVVALASTLSSTLQFSGGTLRYAPGNTTDYSPRFSTAPNQPLLIDTNNQHVTLASNITSASGTLTKTGPGTLTLSGSNNFTGTLFVDTSRASGDDGSLRVTSAAAVGPASLIAIRNNNAAHSSLQLDGTPNNITLPHPLSISARTSTTSASLHNLAGHNTLTGQITLNVGGQGYAFQSDAGSLTIHSPLSPAGVKTLTLQGSADGTLRGPVTNGTGTFSLAKSGPGTWTLAGANTYSGPTTVTAGTLLLYPDAWFPVLTTGADLRAGRITFNYAATSSPLESVASAIASNLITSSTAPPTHTLGYADDGAATVTLLYTLKGDANLNGAIDPDDYALLDKGFLTSATHWSQGDFNHDRQVTPSDYLLLDTAFAQQQGGQLSPAYLSARQSQFGPAYIAQLLTAIPEPALTACLFAGYPLLRRRNRHHTPRTVARIPSPARLPRQGFP